MLQKCYSLKSSIENEILMHKRGGETPLLDGVPVVKGSSLTSYIVDLEKDILPQLDYIIRCLKKKKRIKKSKIHIGSYIVHEWSLDSELGSKLVDLEKALFNERK